jgi:hypothetical protein
VSVSTDEPEVPPTDDGPAEPQPVQTEPVDTPVAEEAVQTDAVDDADDVVDTPVPSEALPLRRDVVGEAERVLARAAEARGAEPVATSLPRAPRDPYDAARDALARAAEARGVQPDPDPFPVTRKGPMEAANEALAKAREAQAHARAGGTAGRAREEAARAQLEQLKRGGAASAPRRDDDGPDEAPAPGTPRKRTL